MGRKRHWWNKRPESGKDFSLLVSIPLDKVCVSFPVSIPLDKVSVQSSTNVHGLKCDLLSTLPRSWVDISPPTDSDVIIICKPSYYETSNTSRVQFTIQIKATFNWSVFLHNNLLSYASCSVLHCIPCELHGVDDVLSLIRCVEKAKICQGHCDSKYKCLVRHRNGKFHDNKGMLLALEDLVTLDKPTIRSSHCEFLLDSDSPYSKCRPCYKIRTLLRIALSRYQHVIEIASLKRVGVHSHVNHRYLLEKEKDFKLRHQHQHIRSLERKLTHMATKLSIATEKVGVHLNSDMHEDVCSIMKQEDNEVVKLHPEGSFQRMFWSQQLNASRVQKASAMKWHPLMIKWCLYLRYKSSGAYEALRESGCLKLPSQRTLRDYTHVVKAANGFTLDIDEQLVRVSKLLTLKEWQKCVALVIDEMFIREDLVYDKTNDELIGFTDLGDINNHLVAYEKCLNEDTCPTVANSMLVFMVCSFFTQMKYPYVQFPCANVSGDLLFAPIWEAVFRLERCGFKVLTITFDGAAANRRFLKLMGSEKVLFKVINKYSLEKRPLFFFSDPPHLLKTTRNCLASKARHLWCNGSDILFQHITDMYYRDREKSMGLLLLPKIKLEHIQLTPFSRMRVDLAAQLLSETVAKALVLSGDPAVQETAKFVTMFDKFFDALNVSNYTSGVNKRKVFQQPYRSGDDFRLKWLKEEFLVFLDTWEQSVQARPGFSASEKQKMLLSPQTLLGLRITVNSFIGLVQYLFTLEGVESFLSQRIGQDPLEKFFGCQRQRGATSDNPNVSEFQKNMQTIRIVDTMCRPSVRGNCQEIKNQHPINPNENTPLLKRKSKRKKSKKAKQHD
ncbi:hypothetical protein EMCRGX_G011503 [Ephydatia muelleri]